MVRLSNMNSFIGIALATLLAVTLPACSPQEEIQTYEEPGSAANAQTTTGSSANVPNTSQSAPVVERLTYETPAGWMPGEIGGMRKAAFHVDKEERRIDITVIDLAESAGDLILNVNRWRQQIKLGAITEEEIKKDISPIEVAGSQGHFVEMIGPEDADPRQAILAVIVTHGSRAWFFKLWGDVELAQQERERFREFAKSVTFAAADGGEND